ncbi:MAG: FAD-dependent oxidoreductase [Acidobacteriaceae bacterium]
MIEPQASKLLEPSQGIHLVFDGSFLPGGTAMMVPHTSDGRILFAIPWHGHTLVGTTDTPIERPTYNPLPQEEEIRFILDTAARYISHPPLRSDVLSVYTGIRPVVHPEGFSGKTSSLLRDHTIRVDKSGLLTIVGGKWTTYEHMAEDYVDQAILLGKRCTSCMLQGSSSVSMGCLYCLEPAVHNGHLRDWIDFP